MSLKKQALSGMLWTFAQQFSVQGISFLVTVVLARILLPQEFGLIAMISIFVSLSNVLITSGMTQSLIRTKSLDEDDYSTVFLFNLVVSLLVYISLFAVSPLISDFYGQEMLTRLLRVYSVVFIIDAFSAIQVTRLTKNLDFKRQLKVTLPSIIISGAVGIVLALFNFGVWSLVGSAITRSFLTSLFYWLFSSWRPKLQFKIEKFKQHFSFGIKMMLSSTLDIIFTNLYTIIIGKYFTPAQVGYYNRAQQLQMLPVGNISSILGKVTYPIFSKMQNDDQKLKSVFIRILKMAIFCVAPVVTLMTALAEPLIIFLFTDKWLPTVPYLQIIFLNGILYPLHSYNLQILTIKGYSGLFLKLEIIKKFVVAFSILTSYSFGIFPLLVASVVASVISFFINSYYSGKLLNYNSCQQIKDLFPIFIIALLAGAFVYGIDYFLSIQSINIVIRLIAGLFVGSGIYLSLSKYLKIDALNEIITIIQKK